MYNHYQTSPCSYCIYAQRYYSNYRYDDGSSYPCSQCYEIPRQDLNYWDQHDSQYDSFQDDGFYDSRLEDWEDEGNEGLLELRDYGPEPFVVNINEAAKQNDTFRTALWTGKHLQVTLMSINVGEDIGLEIHPNLDQFIRIEEGQGLVKMGDSRNNLNFQRNVYDDFALIIPAGKYHNLINTGNTPLKLYSIYAPPQHPQGTVHETKAEAMAAEEEHGH